MDFCRNDAVHYGNEQRYKPHAHYHKQYLAYFAVHAPARGEHVAYEHLVRNVRRYDPEPRDQREREQYEHNVILIPHEHLEQALYELGLFHTLGADLAVLVGISAVALGAEMLVLVFVLKLFFVYLAVLFELIGDIAKDIDVVAAGEGEAGDLGGLAFVFADRAPARNE